MVFILDTFYATLHAFQVSTQIDFLIIQTILPTTKNGFNMTKEKLMALITVTLDFLLIHPCFVSFQSFKQTSSLFLCLIVFTFIPWHAIIKRNSLRVRCIMQSYIAQCNFSFIFTISRIYTHLDVMPKYFLANDKYYISI